MTYAYIMQMIILHVGVLFTLIVFFSLGRSVVSEFCLPTILVNTFWLYLAAIGTESSGVRILDGTKQSIWNGNALRCHRCLHTLTLDDAMNTEIFWCSTLNNCTDRHGQLQQTPLAYTSCIAYIQKDVSPIFITTCNIILNSAYQHITQMG